jgi:hypothetical protein
MTLQKAKEILTIHRKWTKGEIDEIPPYTHNEIGEAVDVLLEAVEVVEVTDGEVERYLNINHSSNNNTTHHNRVSENVSKK